MQIASFAWLNAKIEKISTKDKCENYGFFCTILLQKHVKWYIPHKMTGKETIVRPQEDIRKESKVVDNIMERLTKGESEKYWAVKRRTKVSEKTTPLPTQQIVQVPVETQGLKKILSKLVINQKEKRF